jgi:hypothetical protein
MGTKLKAIKEAASILYALLELKKVEKQLTVNFIDALASEYGWSIEYIQKLTLEEIGHMINQIKIRKDREDILSQMNQLKAFSGKVSSNRRTPEKEEESDESKRLRKLSQDLGIPIKKIKEDN